MTENPATAQPSGRGRSPVVRFGLPLAAVGAITAAAGFGVGRVTAPGSTSTVDVHYMDCPNPNVTVQTFTTGPAEKIRVERLLEEAGVRPQVEVTWRDEPPADATVATWFESPSFGTGEGAAIESVSGENTVDGVTTVTGDVISTNQMVFAYGAVGEGLTLDYESSDSFGVTDGAWLVGAGGSISGRGPVTQGSCEYGL